VEVVATGRAPHQEVGVEQGEVTSSLKFKLVKS